MINRESFYTCLFICLSILLAFIPTIDSIASQAPSLAQVLERAGMYVKNYEKNFSNIVAEEQYLQKVTRQNRVRKIRKSRADVLLVWLADTEEWAAFRDILEVDGRKVRERSGRLQKLFLESPATLREVSDESARYNIGNIGRNFNVPTLALTFLEPDNQPRFKFKKKGEKKLEGRRVWVIEFSEKVSPTIIQSNGSDVFARGTFWIAPEDGRVLKSVMIAGGRKRGVPRSRIDVTYSENKDIGCLVPHEMREMYDYQQLPLYDIIHCRASYSNFRVFDVHTEDKIEVKD